MYKMAIRKRDNNNKNRKKGKKKKISFSGQSVLNKGIFIL